MEPLAAFVGLIAMRWTLIEKELTEMVAKALGLSWPNAGGGWSMTGHPMVRVAMQEQETIRARLKLADAFLGPTIERAAMKEDWEALKKQLRARAKERNRIVHAEWVLSDDNRKPGLIEFRGGTEFTLWVEQDFKHVSKRLLEQFNMLHSFAIEMLEKSGATKPDIEGGELPVFRSTP